MPNCVIGAVLKLSNRNGCAGNISKSQKAGLLFIDFDTGDTLQITGAITTDSIFHHCFSPT